MTLPEKIAAVEQLFVELDACLARFQQNIPIHCPPGCGKCCLKPDIEATVLEFLPLAMHLFRQGKAEAWYEKLKTEPPALCILLHPMQTGKGMCGSYPHRGLICRLFGYAVRTNKYGKPELVTCQVLRTQPGYTRAETIAQTGNDVPHIRNWYLRLQVIDPVLGNERLPINEAICKALEVVMLDMTYRLSA